VSSILDALRKLEEAETPRASGRGALERSRRTFPVALGVVVVVAFAAGAGLAFWLRGGTPPAPTQPVETASAEPAVPPPPLPADVPEPAPLAKESAPAAAAVVTQPEPAPVAAPPPAAPAGALAPAAPTPAPPRSFDGEPPRAHVMEPAAPPPPATAARSAAPPEPEVAARDPEPDVAVHPPAPAVAAREPAPAEPPSPPPHGEDVLPRPPSGAPPIEVNFLAYSRTPARRTVALTIGGTGGMVTMHEGDTAGDVEVVRILPDRVHVRHAGQLFAVRAVP
jgi:hypothetical protein